MEVPDPETHILFPMADAKLVAAAADLGCAAMNEIIQQTRNTPLEAGAYDTAGEHLRALAAFKVAIDPELRDPDEMQF